MVLIEETILEDLQSQAAKSEQLEKEKLALEILAHEKSEEAAAAMAQVERLKLEASRLQHTNNILMEHYALSRHRQFGASSEKTPVGQEQMLFNEAEACASVDA